MGKTAYCRSPAYKLYAYNMTSSHQLILSFCLSQHYVLQGPIIAKNVTKLLLLHCTRLRAISHVT